MLIFQSLDPVPLSTARMRHMLEHGQTGRPWSVNHLEALTARLANEITLESLVVDEHAEGMEGYRIVAQPGLPYIRYWEIRRREGRRTGSREILHRETFILHLLQRFAERVASETGHLLYAIGHDPGAELTYAEPLYRRLFLDSLTSAHRPRLVPTVQLPPPEEIYAATRDFFEPLPWSYGSYGDSYRLSRTQENNGFHLRITDERGNGLLDQSYESHSEAVCVLIGEMLGLTAFNRHNGTFDPML